MKKKAGWMGRLSHPWKQLKMEYGQLEKPGRRELLLSTVSIVMFAVIAAVMLRAVDTGFGLALSRILSYI